MVDQLQAGRQAVDLRTAIAQPGGRPMCTRERARWLWPIAMVCFTGAIVLFAYASISSRRATEGTDDGAEMRPGDRLAGGYPAVYLGRTG